ncbi:elongator complex subunit 1 [Parastagonospora nodorum]|uniref:Elongator complex protein 1 n=1 Tax=Phaeosphaeria nodorum (strain SN15 / ATCC MYA-4574 / FGSC 10173) TaxID=321614 RepID=A0A7U2FG74_PHANO|nr:elongator complex subunit 1 [Parastagonospora nodorum]QRD02276.1 elongator complex subunit 1 [Parastagonospora nodorum SN15]KAH3935575.1 elongator complex subunit 1 [Parastagonospora nodorum]KAH3948643.1 elongator complex subunit 1 [Parastagonospora nodorum]KAH3970059.1 elongator complex subunit 1 [Parastagonospora nodorum]
MRNLKIVARSLLRFSGEDPLPITATAWDPASNALICAFGPSESRATIELKRLHYTRNGAEDRLESIAAWDAPCPLPSLTHDSILSLHHFSDSSTSCLILAGGDIILVRENPVQNEELVEIVGSVDTGISAAAWSPDEELLAITTLADTLLLMSRDIENIASVTLAPEDVNVSSHVSVGWGKKETQFKGKRARALQDPTVPETIDEGVLSPCDDRCVIISWRGDGAYFAVNKVEEERRRMIRVYSREGQLDSVSEPVDGLEGALSWRPSGNLIAGVCRSSDKIEVVFFERNGLRHGQFDLRFTVEELERLTVGLKLKWNSDSNVLAVSHPDKVQLWTMSNYHYYLKQELVFPEPASTTATCTWHSEKPLSVALSTSGALQILEYASVVAAGSTAPPNDFGMVASIDGLSLKLTPLRLANVPPPMAFHTLALEHKAIDVAVSETGNKVAVLSDNDIALYALDLSKRPIPKPILLWKSNVIKTRCPRHVTFVGDERLFCLTDNWDEEESCLWRSEGPELLPLGPIIETVGASSLLSDVDFMALYVQFQDGSLHLIDTHGDSTDLPPQTSLVHKFPSLVPEVKVVTVEGQTLAFALTKSGVLYANGRALVRNCTSFAVTSAHLIFTTTQHLLKFVHLAGADELEIPLDEPQKDERCRSIERGAKIITVMPTTYSVVLQMPRGNLETIYPRALVLAAIRRSIEAEQYFEAFLACRNQRVDMNILHDHDPERFLSNIEVIINQIQRIEHLDLLLAQLRNEDVSETMYKETLKAKDLVEKSKLSQAQVENKVNRISDAFLAVLEEPKYKDEHLQNIITAHVSKVPPALEAGLEMIGRLQTAQDPLTDKAAEHICFLADVNQLYETSLGLYNLDLALLIAQQSQKDPREYLPHLQSLQDLPPIRRQFQIDDQLGRRAKALAHLNELQAHDEVQEYVQKHALYSEALAMYQYDNARLKEIMQLYADYLRTTNKNKDAALAYEYLGDHASAWPCYRAANLWREALSSATLASVPASELETLASSLIEDFTESKDYFAAATITLDYFSDPASAARLLCRGAHFAEAVRIVTLRRQPDLIAEVIDPGLIERSADMTEFLADMKGQLQAQVPRLRDLRLKKAEDPMAFFEGIMDGADANIPDNISLAPTDTTSGGTFMTRYTHQTGTVNTQATRKTSKNKRREERKRARGKKGTVYEEEYLTNSIERLIERINSMQDEIERLIEGLVKRGMRERADAVSNAVNEVIERCRDAVKEMYPQTDEAVGGVSVGADANGVEGEMLRPTGGDATLWDSLQEVEKKREAPVVKAFARLSLLG